MFKWAVKYAVNKDSGLARNNIVIEYVGIKLIQTECRISKCEHSTHVCNKTSP